MTTNRFKAAEILSALIAVLAALASSAGLFTGLYRDNTFVIAAFRGNDLLTLFLAVPLLITVWFLYRRGSLRAQLIWYGTLLYMLYNYVFYLYGAAFNRFFLVYVALVVFSIYALIFGLLRLDTLALQRRFCPRTPTRWISAFMLFFAILLGGMWIARAIGAMLTLGSLAPGEIPQDIAQFGHPTAVVYATDLTILIPALILGAVWLWQRRSWGFALSVIVLVKACTYGLALITMSLYSKLTTGGVDPFLALWIFLTAGCLTCCIFLLWNLRSRVEG